MRTFVFTTCGYEEMGTRVARLAAVERGELERTVFADGERYLRLKTEVEGCGTVVLGGTISDSDTLELYDLACGVVEGGARTLTIAIPYFGYGTMERAVRPHEVVIAKTRARLLSSLPLPGSGSRVLLLDLHTEGIPFYFEGALRAVHLYGQAATLEAIRRLGPEAVGCTDVGRAKWVERFANELGVPAAFVFKRRDQTLTEVSAVCAQVQGRRVIIYDDLIRSGSSLINAARAYREAGARSVAAVATHGVFPGDALERIEQSGLIEKVIVTDSHPRAVALAGSFLEVVTVAPIFAGYLKENPCSS
jgi:ribose-phosphate pyrophosphokinase